jgi:hypothetical protein
VAVSSPRVDEDPAVEATGSDGAAGPVPAEPASQIRPWVLRLAFALALAPLAVSAVNLLVGHRHDVSFGDVAMTELLTRDVGTRWLELGPFSRDGWYHPGPAMYYALAGPYRLLGSTAAALDVGALLINGVSVAGMGLIARRRGGPALALLTLVGCALLVRSLGTDPIRQPWNPWLTVLPYGLLVFLTVALACGDRWALPLAVGVASFVAQTHVGYVPLALPLLVVGAAWLVAATPRGERRARLAVPSLVALVVGAVMWLPVVTQQLTNSPGNLRRIAEWFRTGGPRHDAAHTLTTGWRVVSLEYVPPPQWVAGLRPLTSTTAEPLAIYRPLFPGLLLLVAVAAIVLWRQRPPAGRPLVVVWLVASLIGIVATARTLGPVFFYRLGWSWVLGMVGGVIAAWAGWRALTGWRPSLERRALVPASLALLAVMAVVTSVAHVHHGTPDPLQSGRTARLLPQVEAALPDRDGVVVVESASFDGAGYANGLLVGLERDGYDVRLPRGQEFAGRNRVYAGEPVRASLVATTDIGIADGLADPNLELVAYTGDISLDELRARAAATRKVVEAFESGDAAALEELAQNSDFITPRTTAAIFAKRDAGSS